MSVLSPTFEYVAVLQCMSRLRPGLVESHCHPELLGQVLKQNYCRCLRMLLDTYVYAPINPCRRLHKQELLDLRQQLKTASVSSKGGEKESDRLKKELDKAR
jgi:hypothetical protein